MRGLQPRGEANKRGITPNQVARENWGKRELGSIGTAGENRPALDRSTAQPLPRSPFPARLFGSNLNNSPIKGSLDYPGGRPACRALRSELATALGSGRRDTQILSAAFLIFAPGTKAVAPSEANLQELPPTTRYRTKVPSVQELKFQPRSLHPCEIPLHTSISSRLAAS